MPTITITLNGELEQLNPYLQLITGLSAKIDAKSTPTVEMPTETVILTTQVASKTDDWTLDEFVRLWNHLSKNAKAFLKELAKKPSGYHAPELKQKTGLDTKNLGGACNSASNQRKSLGMNKSPIFGREGWENNGYLYTMPKAIADYVLQLP